MTQTEEKYEKICKTWEEPNLQHMCAMENEKNGASKIGVVEERVDIMD